MDPCSFTNSDVFRTESVHFDWTIDFEKKAIIGSVALKCNVIQDISWNSKCFQDSSALDKWYGVYLSELELDIYRVINVIFTGLRRVIPQFYFLRFSQPHVYASQEVNFIVLIRVVRMWPQISLYCYSHPFTETNPLHHTNLNFFINKYLFVSRSISKYFPKRFRHMFIVYIVLSFLYASSFNSVCGQKRNLADRRSNKNQLSENAR